MKIARRLLPAAPKSSHRPGLFLQRHRGLPLDVLAFADFVLTSDLRSLLRLRALYAPLLLLLLLVVLFDLLGVDERAKQTVSCGPGALGADTGQLKVTLDGQLQRIHGGILCRNVESVHTAGVTVVESACPRAAALLLFCCFRLSFDVSLARKKPLVNRQDDHLGEKKTRESRLKRGGVFIIKPCQTSTS